MRGPRCLFWLTPVQPQMVPPDPRKGRVRKGSELEAHRRGAEEGSTDSGLREARDSGAFDLSGPCASWSGLGDSRKTPGEGDNVVHLSLTPLNFLALESANFPCPHPLPPGTLTGIRMQGFQPNHPESRKHENPRNPGVAWDSLTGTCRCSCSYYPKISLPSNPSLKPQWELRDALDFRCD